VTFFPQIHLVTDRRRLAEPDDVRARAALLDLAERAAAAGVTAIQVRERDLPDGPLLDLVSEIVRRVGDQSQVLVNDRPDVALAAGAAGAHLRADGPPGGRIRAVVPNGFVLGRSVHNLEEAAAAWIGGGLNYVLMGTVFATESKPEGHSTAGLAGLRAVVERSSLPVIAIGGITAARAPAVAATGASGVAAVGLFLEAARGGPGALPAAVKALRAAFGDGPRRPEASK
jgi:thiamine-phosphate diphosphorylase